MPNYPKYVRKDEWWGEIYECPFCQEDSIWQGFTYCPDCGKKLEWKEEVNHSQNT